MDKVLIIGGNSLLSREICFFEENLSSDVFCTIHKNAENVPNSSKIVTLKEAKQYAFERIYIIAANIPYGQFEEVTDSLITTNVCLPQEVSDSFPDAKLIYSSSIAVFGNQKTVTSTSPLLPCEAYGFSKAAAEVIVKKHSRFSVLRLPSLYGEGVENGFVNRIIKQAKDKEITIYGNGERTQAYVNYKTAAEMLVKMGHEEKSEVLNCILEAPVSNIFIAKSLREKDPSINIKFTGEDNSSSVTFEVINSGNNYNLSTFESITSYIKNNL